jgi:hypothetical protein
MAARDGYFCKSCRKFFTDQEIPKVETRWEAIAGEEWLMEIIAECPHCHETRGYKIPQDVRLEFEQPD